jgi:hypothetical protein
VIPIRLEQLVRQTTCFSTENNAIVVPERPIGIWPFSLRGEVDETTFGQCPMESIQVGMSMQNHFWPIIQASPAHRAVVQAKTCGTHNVEWGSGGSAESRDVAGVLRYLRFNECDINHECSSAIEVGAFIQKGTTSFA